MKIKKLLLVAVFGIAIQIGQLSALAHYTQCTKGSGNTGMCTAKAIKSHGFECGGQGTCLTNPTWLQSLVGVETCDCNGVSEVND